MFKRIAPLLLSCLLGLGILGWWVNQWPAPIPVRVSNPDALWRTITKTAKGFSVGTFEPSSKNFSSYQRGGLLLYGIGTIPSINFGDTPSLSIPDGGQWIIKILDPESHIQVKSSFISGTLDGDGTVFIDTKEKTLINFDAEMTTTTGDKILPSFLRVGDKQSFFDIAEQKDVISPDLWLLYTTFLRRDTVRALGSTSKKDIDILIRNLLSREPESPGGTFHHDLSARNGLEEVSTLINKIDKGDACGADLASCFSLLDDVINKNIGTFPEVFLPVKKSIRSWIQLEPQIQQDVYTWKNIFHTYHNNILTNNPLARVIRDRSILEMVRSGNTVADYETWQYLTRMLADQKLGSVYSLQIVREMMRIGDELISKKDTQDTIKSKLTATAIESLRNLRNLLENAYFIKNDYWFVLRTDLIDSDGKSFQIDTLSKDLQSLIEEINNSKLLRGLTPSDSGGKDLSVIKAQLVWFKCILSRNAEYVANPRVCRITVSQ